MTDNRYMMRGVSAAKEDVHNAIKNIDKGIFPQAFCKIIPDILGGDPEYCNIMHADGAGTKSSLAYMYWKETGDLSVWKGIAQDAIVMNTDDLLCVGAVDNILVSSTIGRNKMLVPGEVISAIINGTDELLADVIVGLSSTGRATYEKRYNGGMGSNGLTSARHDVFAKYLAEKYPESFDHAVPDELVYSGKYKLTDNVEDSPVDAGQLVLSPTRTYAPVIKRLLDELRPEIHGMVAESLRTTCSLCLLCSRPSMNAQVQTGRRCIRCLTWDTAWRSMCVQRLPRRLSTSQRVSTSTLRLSAISKKARRA